MKINYLLLAFLLLLNSVYAQNNYVYVSPKPNSILVSSKTNIILRSNSIVDRSSLNLSLISVVGSQSGLHTGQLILSDDKRTIVFNPDQQFVGNEIVTVSMLSGVKTKDGSMLPSYSFNFTTIADDAQVASQLNSQSTVQSDYSNAQYLPAPPITIDSVNNPSPGYIFMATWDRNAPQHIYANYLFILDNYGNILDSIRVNGAPFDFKIQPNGLLSYGLGDYSGIVPGANSNLTHYVLDSTLAVVDSFQMKNGYLTDFHMILFYSLTDMQCLCHILL
ncbi:MAG: Ig-like domain-containing protein [Ignavibacteriales bacterium]|nr:Ig-like domain-containing protein [Ignavibacteriales bacterium]